MPQQARPKDIRIICGLGNPGPEYASTRHNAGFATIDALAERHGARYWKSEAGCMVARCTMRAPEGTREVLLAKPQDYMNTSGGPLSKLLRQEKASAQEVLVVHDEVDLAAGTVNVKFGGGLNAHNGLRSIANKLGTRDFARLRFGIGRPPGKMQVADYVLRTLKGSYLQEFELEAQDAATLAELVIERGVQAAIDR